jgi:hypothetical protein
MTDFALRLFVVTTRILPPGWPISGQRVPPSAITRRALPTGTSAAGRAACTISASGVE